MLEADVEEALVEADLAMMVTAVKGRSEGMDGETKGRPETGCFSSLSA